MRVALQTARMELRCFGPGDAADLHEIFSDPLTHTIGVGPFSSLAQTESWIGRRVKAFDAMGLAWYGLRLRENGLLVGNCGVFVGRTGSAEPEVGYEIRHAYRGRGLAREAARAVLDECFAAGTGRVWATIRPHNTVSLRIATGLGMAVQYARTDERGELLYLSCPAAGTGDTGAVLSVV